MHCDHGDIEGCLFMQGYDYGYHGVIMLNTFTCRSA